MTTTLALEPHLDLPRRHVEAGGQLLSHILDQERSSKTQGVLQVCPEVLVVQVGDQQ